MIKPLAQKKVWDKIAKEWHEYKKIPSKLSVEFLNKQKGKVLDFGSGSGRHLQKIKNGKMYLVDFSKNMIELAKEKAKENKIPSETIISDMTKTPFENNFFDSAICISALHCLNKTQQKKAIQELYRILKPDANALIGVWNKKSKRFNNPKSSEKYISWTDKGKRYYYLFEENEIHELFKKTGFEIISSHNSEMMMNFIVKKSFHHNL